MRGHECRITRDLLQDSCTDTALLSFLPPPPPPPPLINNLNDYFRGVGRMSHSDHCLHIIPRYTVHYIIIICRYATRARTLQPAKGGRRMIERRAHVLNRRGYTAPVPLNCIWYLSSRGMFIYLFIFLLFRPFRTSTDKSYTVYLTPSTNMWPLRERNDNTTCVQFSVFRIPQCFCRAFVCVIFFIFLISVSCPAKTYALMLRVKNDNPFSPPPPIDKCITRLRSRRGRVFCVRFAFVDKRGVNRVNVTLFKKGFYRGSFTEDFVYTSRLCCSKWL